MMTPNQLRSMLRANANRSIVGKACLALCDAPSVQATAPIVVQSGTCGSDPAHAFTLGFILATRPPIWVGGSYPMTGSK